MKKNSVLKKLEEKILSSKSFLITAHMSVEGDALGSELAVYLLLKKLKKKAVIYNHDLTPEIYKFLPSYGVIENTARNSKFDVAMVLDCADSSRAGKVKDSLSNAGCIINIDHHVSNTYFGDINWVEPSVSSTCQMLYALCEKFKVMDRNMAICLYTGIFTDTGSFTYASTDAETHRIISSLMKYRIYTDKIDENLRSSCTPSDLKVIGKIISSLKFDSNRKICWANITDWKDKNYDLSEVVFSVMKFLKGVEVFILFKKVNNKRTRINFRSRSDVDVNKIAKFFGGGGHKKASGTMIEDALDVVERKVISFVKRYTNDSKDKK